jgi:hypothetical protein
MMAGSGLPLRFGSRLQRISAVVCLAFALYFAFSGYQSAKTMRMRVERARQLNLQNQLQQTK